MIAVDVNVVAYLLIEGEHTETAERLASMDSEWAAPLLWRSEWRNILAGYMRRGAISRLAAEAAVTAAEEVFRGREYLPDSRKVLELVEHSACSAYDCEYVAVAQAMGVPLATWDREVLDAFPDTASTPADLMGMGRNSP